jgi:hypothetical protein
MPNGGNRDRDRDWEWERWRGDMSRQIASQAEELRAHWAWRQQHDEETATYREAAAREITEVKTKVALIAGIAAAVGATAGGLVVSLLTK